MLKKTICALCAVTLFAFVSCGKNGGDDSSSGKAYRYKGLNITDNLGSSTGTVSFMVGGGTVELRLWDELLSAFETANPGIKVDKVTINDFDVLYTQLIAGTAPDVIQMESPSFGNWAKSGALQSIEPLVLRDAFDISDYWPQLIEMYSFDTENGIRGSGDLFALPKDMGVYGVFVNKNIVEAARHRGDLSEEEYALVTDRKNPMTYTQYLQVAKKLTKYDPYNAAETVYGSNRVYWESFLWSMGGDILDENNQFYADNLKFKRVLEYSKAMVTKGSEDFCAPYSAVTSSASQDEMSMFMTGRIAMFWGGRWLVPNYDAAGMNYYCIPTPVAENDDGTKGESIGWCSTIGYGVSRNCKNGEMAWQLIKFLTSAEGYRIMNRLNYNVPGRMSLVTEPAFANPVSNGSRLDADSAQIFFETARKARINNASRFSSPNWINIFEEKLGLYFTDEIKTYEELMGSVKNQVNSAIRNSDPQLFR